MLREPPDERDFLIIFKPFSVRPEPGEGLRELLNSLLEHTLIRVSSLCSV